MFQKLLNNKFFQIGLFLIAIYIIFQTIYTFGVNYYEKINLEDQYTQTQKEYDQVENQYKTISDPENKEKYFREKYHLSKDGEILFDFPDEK